MNPDTMFFCALHLHERYIIHSCHYILTSLYTFFNLMPSTISPQCVMLHIHPTPCTGYKIHSCVIASMKLK